MKEETRVVAILFADLTGYSQISNDTLLAKLDSFAQDFREKFLSRENHFYMNTWGDAFFICSDDPFNLLEIALNLRDFYRNTNWKRHGFSRSLSIRIGLHVEKATIVLDDDKVSNVVGKHINATARIEPIVDQNCIWCSEKFYILTYEDATDFAVFRPIGKKELAKGFGVMSLYEVLRIHEHSGIQEKVNVSRTEAWGMSVPRIKKKFTDKELEDFQKDGFRRIEEYFRKALDKLKEIDSDLQTNFEKTRVDKFNCKVFVRGELRATCQIWSVLSGINQGIHYATYVDDRENSYNENIMAADNGYEMYFQTTGMLSFDRDKDHYTAEEIAHLLWSDFTRQLEQY